MSKRAKRAKSTARKIRRVAKEILSEKGGEMGLSELYEETQKILNASLRFDFFKGSITTQGAGITVDTETSVAMTGNRTGNRKEVKKMVKKPKAESKLGPEEFTLLAIKRLSNPPHKAIHAVYSGFNAAFREFFPGMDPVKEVQALAKAGKVSIRPAKGGVVIFAGQEGSFASAEKALKKMGLK